MRGLRHFPQMNAGPSAGAMLLLAAGLAAAGCGGPGYALPPLDVEQARDTLETALACWKEGEPLEALNDYSPPIVVLDIDWNHGRRLFDFEILDGGQEVDGHLVSPVKLTLQDDGGARIEQLVTYRVTTSPALAVLREIRR